MQIKCVFLFSWIMAFAVSFELSSCLGSHEQTSECSKGWEGECESPSYQTIKCEWTVCRTLMASERALRWLSSSVHFRMSAWKSGPSFAVGSSPVTLTGSPSEDPMAGGTSTSAWCASGCCEYWPLVALGQPEQFAVTQQTSGPSSVLFL